MPTDLLALLGPPGWCSGDGDIAGGAVASSFWRIVVRRFGGGRWSRAVGATDDDDDVGFAWSGRWRRRGATYGVDRSTMANSQAPTCREIATYAPPFWRRRRKLWSDGRGLGSSFWHIHRTVDAESAVEGLAGSGLS